MHREQWEQLAQECQERQEFPECPECRARARACPELWLARARECPESERECLGRLEWPECQAECRDSATERRAGPEPLEHRLPLMAPRGCPERQG